MSLTENRYWKDLRKQIERGSTKQVWLISLTGAVLPIIENILCSLATSSPPDAGKGGWIALVAVGIVHILLLVLLFQSTGDAAPKLLADATEAADGMAAANAELERRNQAYRLVRGAFDLLNVQTCMVSAAVQDTSWCQNGFRNAAGLLLQVLVPQIDLILGVRSQTFTVELYMQTGHAMRSPTETIGPNWREEFTYQSRPMAKLLPTNPRSPVAIFLQSKRPFRLCTEQMRHVFYRDEKQLPEVYFTRMVACPVQVACDPDSTMGCLVVTCVQGTDFTNDAEDVLAFLASAVSNLAYRYNECVMARPHI